MEFKILKSAGSDDFHQELIDCLNQKYQDLEVFINDLLRNCKELNIKRLYRDGFFTISVSIIDINNEVATIDWIGIG